VQEISKRIVPWFRQSARKLPWRETSDPYQIWISEIMCQQTGVSTVIPYYERFLARFPSLHDLAGSSDDEVIKLWEGLGYYSRARNLLKAAQLVVEKFGGQLPESYEDLRSLPGIGAYSAGAILAIAFRKSYAALDGNLIRVYSRVFKEDRAVDRPEVLRDLWKLAESLVPTEPKDIRDFTEGVMELGASICRPKNPLCPLCPLKSICLARKVGIEASLPIKSKSTKRVKLFESIFWEEKSGKVRVLKKGIDPKFPYFHRLPYQVEAKKPKELHLKYSVTHRDFWVRLRKERVPRGLLRKSDWIKISELKNLVFPAIDRKVMKAISLRDKPAKYFQEECKP